MPDQKNKDQKPASPKHEVIATAERRFAKADEQRANIKADPKGEVIRQRRRIKRAKKDTPE